VNLKLIKKKIRGEEIGWIKKKIKLAFNATRGVTVTRGRDTPGRNDDRVRVEDDERRTTSTSSTGVATHRGERGSRQSNNVEQQPEAADHRAGYKKCTISTGS